MRRRAFIIGAGQVAVLGVLGTRLGWLQLKENERYQTLSERNRIDIRLIAPSRGMIYDRRGVPLAINEQDFRLQLLPEQVDDIGETLRKVAQYVDLRPSEIESAIAKAKKQASFIPVEIKNNLDWSQVSTVEVNMTEFPGVYVDVGERRSYPLRDETAHVVGYVGAVSRSDLDGDPVLALPGFRVGKAGMEKSVEDLLRGKPGTKKVEVNVSGRVVRDLDVQPGIKGKDMALTIDAELQGAVQGILSVEKSASAVVMDVHTGEVYAMVSHPAFDPNLFTSGISVNQWEELLANDGNPLTNKAISGQYPPGSTFKMVTALAGLEAGVIDHVRTAYCNGHYDIGDHRFHCWKKTGHGRVDLVQALAQSCDVYFYDMARDVGIDKIAEVARRLGLSQTYNFELKEEREGLMPDRSWKMAHMGEKWQPGETVVASIGQGYILSTPLQLAVMTARLVNGGVGVKPWIAGAMEDVRSTMAGRNWPELGFKKAHLDLVRDGMWAVMNHDKGTAHGARPKGEPVITMAGKTGTAQVRRITRQQRNEGLLEQSEIPWKYRHHALFVGYAPADKPQYVTCVVVEHGASGSASAAPLAGQILQKAIALDVKSRAVALPSSVDRSEAVKRQQQEEEKAAAEQAAAQEDGKTDGQDGEKDRETGRETGRPAGTPQSVPDPASPPQGNDADAGQRL